VGDDTALDEIDEYRRNAGLHDVPAEHDDYAALVSMRIHYRIDDTLEITRD
jgi:hypothetical protein